MTDVQELFKRRDALEARAQANADQQSRVEQAIREAQMRVAELRASLTALEPTPAPSRIEALLNGTGEELDESEIAATARQKGVLTERLKHLEADAQVLHKHRSRLASEAEAITRERNTVAIDELRMLEQTLIRRYHDQMAQLVANAIIPLLAICNELRAYGQTTISTPLLAWLQLNAFADGAHPTRLPAGVDRPVAWMHNGALTHAALTPALRQLAQRPAGDTVAALLNELRASAQRRGASRSAT